MSWLAGAAMLAAVPVTTMAWAGAAEEERATVATETEAWYHTVPACPAVMCAAATVDPPNPYPHGTLHVAVSGGHETARTYLDFGNAAVPHAGDISSVTLRLPVAGSDAGTRDPEAARLRVCLTTEPIQRVEGSAAPPPAIDCAVSSAAKLTAGDDDNPGAAFIADLAPFLPAWQAGNRGLALVPDAAALTPAAIWHVAFSGRERETGHDEPITAQIISRTGVAAAPASTAPSVPRVGQASDDALAPPETSPQALPAPSTTGSDPVAPPAPNRTRLTTMPRPARGFSNTAIFYLPLAMLGIGSYLARSLTTPIRAEHT